MSTAELKDILEHLTGQKPPFTCDIPVSALDLLGGTSGLGLSQLNELLLMLGYDRMTHAFFQFLVDGSTDYSPGSSISSFEQLRDGVDRFRKMAIVMYGNVKYAFKNLSRDQDTLEDLLHSLQPMDEEEFTKRHGPVLPFHAVSPEDTYYLGYVIKKELEERIKKGDTKAKTEEERRLSIVDKGKANHNAYLACDHLDVYVATSMRQRHEYMFVNRTINQTFNHPYLEPLKLRWFDPTQAYCEDRIDKGLSEALMLKRAKCTIYLAQESDTFGKDSELACTLAQGKPVVAYIPDGSQGYVDQLLSDLREINGQASDQEVILDQLHAFDGSLAWRDSEVQGWVRNPNAGDLEQMKARLTETIKRQYDNRARMLCETHPLGIQVNISTGVANGVLVVRTIEQCARLIRQVVLRQLEFDLEQVSFKTGEDYLLLKEKISGCVFRVVTGDAMLTNTFWNYYLELGE